MNSTNRQRSVRMETSTIPVDITGLILLQRTDGKKVENCNTVT